MTEPAAQIPGWYGKIPALGDFASRRLPQEFIAVWDRWLQHGLAASRARLGSRWLDVYLTSPIWRFAAAPEAIDGALWAGLMMPSVDKAGRHFPLTVALRLDAAEGSVADLLAAEAWFAQIEEAALATLDMSFSAQQFEERLAALPFPVSPRGAGAGPARALAEWLAGGEPLSLSLAGVGLPQLVEEGAWAAFAAVSRGASLWWSPAGDEEALLHAFRGLPPEECFAGLLQLTGAFV